MNHEGTQQYAFGYGLANTQQIQLQQPQQMQLQTHQLQHQQQQILQHQSNQAISQNLYQLSLSSNPTALLQPSENGPMALAQSVHPGTAQHGIISQPVIQANMSVSLDKPLHGLSSLDTVMYPSQNNGYKIISNSGNFVQQPDAVMGVRQAFHGVDALGKSSVLEGVTSQGNVYTFGKQTYSGWMQQSDLGSHHANIGQSSLPSFSHLWSQFQQQKAHVSIVPRQQQPQQSLNQFQTSAQQIQNQLQQHQLNHLHQSQQQFTVSGIQSVPGIQMIKVQQNCVPDQAIFQRTSLVQCTAAPVQLDQSLQKQPTLPMPNNTLSSLPAQPQNVSQAHSAIKQSELITTVPCSQNSSPSVNSITLQQRDSLQSGVPIIPIQEGAVQSSSSNILNVNNFTLQTPISSITTVSEKVVAKESISTKPPPSHSIFHPNSPSSPDTVKVQTVTNEAFSESGPPKVTVTLDSLTNCQNLAEFPERENLIGDLYQEKSLMRNEKATLQGSTPSQSYFSEKRAPLVPKILKLTSSTGSSLDRPSSEDSSFSSPPYSCTPPSSIDSAFSPLPFTKIIPDSQILGVSGSSTPNSVRSPLQSSSVLSSFLPPAPLTCTPSSLPEVSKNRPTASFKSNLSSRVITTESQCLDLQGPPLSSSNGLPSVISSPFISASCCSNALTTTSVTPSSPRSNRGMAVASVHSFTPLSSPSSVASRIQLSDCASFSDKTEFAEQKSIKVPYSWERKLEDGVIVYLSPSRALLTSLDEIRDYLLSDDTCKCGLECPFQLEKAFSFDVAIENKPWEASPDDIMKFCRHQREIMVVAAFHRSQTQAQQSLPDGKSTLRKRRESSGEDLIVTPPKRLKKSITNAVNKHALSLNSISSISPSPAGPKENDPNAVTSPIEAQGPPSNKSPSTVDTINASASGSDPKDSSPMCAIEKGSSVPRSTHQQLTTSPGRQISANLNLSSITSHVPRVCVAKTGNHHPSYAPDFHSPADMPDDAVCQVATPPSSIKSDVQSRVGTERHFSPVSSTPNPSAFVFSNKNYLPPWNSSSLCPSTHTAMTCAAANALDSKSIHVNSFRTSAFTPGHAKSQSTDVISSPKLKSKTSKGKKDKLLKNAAEIPKGFENKSPPLPSSTVSFLENPTVFVAQQAAIINNSIASCQIDCPSPDLINDKPDPKADFLTNSTILAGSGLSLEREGADGLKEELEEIEELDTSKEEEDNKASTDVESNKSFSDATENNDSAYLSQAGSDQEKSDTVDGLDCSLKCSDIYDFNSSEENVESKLILGHGKPSTLSINVNNTDRNRKKEKRLLTSKAEQGLENALKLKESILTDSYSNTNTKQKNIQGKGKPLAVPKTSSSFTPIACSASNLLESPSKDSKCTEEMKTNQTGSLNGDLSQLLASGNWNIPALQEVLAKHSAGDPNGLHSTIQQLVAKASNSNPTPQFTAFQESVKNSISVSQSSKIGEPPPGTKSLTTEVKNPPKAPVQLKSEMKAVSKLETHFDNQKPPSNDGQESPSSKAFQNVAMNKVNTCNLQQQNNASAAQVVRGSDKLPIENLNCDSSQAPLIAQPPNIIASSLSNPPTSVLNISVAPHSNTCSKITAQCSPHGSTVMLNNFNPQVMSVSAPMPPVSVSIVTNVTKSVTQVIPNIGFNQTVLGPQQFLNTRQNPATATQLVNAAVSQQGSHLVSPSSQGAQLMNALSIPGLNTSLVIANPIQQASPSTSVTQLSPAIAGQILAQHQQPLQQMSPSFMPTQIPKQPSTSVIANQGVSTSNTPVPLAVNPISGEVPCTIPQGGLFGSTFHKSPGIAEIQTNCFENKDVLNLIGASRAPSISQSAPIANQSIYPTVSQSLFVIPQAKAAPVMQLLGSSQALNPAAGCQGDVTHLLNQSGVTDQSQQLQNLIAGGFNPLALQQAWNTLNLGAQQQQQLQLLQLQNLMFPLIQNQNQNLSGVAPNANQTTSTLAPQTLMNAVVAQQNLQLNQVVDMKAIQQNLSPVAAQGYANPTMSPVAQGYPSAIQQMPSPITVHQVNAGNPNMTINPHGSHLPNAVNILPPGKPTQVQTAAASDISSNLPPQPSALVQQSVMASQNSGEKSTQDNSPSSSQSSPVVPTKPNPTSTTTSKTQPAKSASKSKSKSKKSDGNKTKDSQASKDEEHIATAVQQILAQAVQQQRELNLAAKNQPPPPPKSRSRKRDSQARARNSQANKEMELGKLASISDDAVEKTAISFKPTSLSPFSQSTSSEGPFAARSLSLNPSQPNCQQPASNPGSVGHQTASLAALPKQTTEMIGPSKMHVFNSPASSKSPKTPVTPVSSSVPFGESISGESTGTVNQVSKKNNISLREHLSSIIYSKDKESGKKRQEKVDQMQNKTRASDSDSSTSSSTASLTNGEPGCHIASMGNV